MQQKADKYMPSESPQWVFDAQIIGLNHEGQGIARHHGKTIFIEGALPSEKVQCQVFRRHQRFDEAKVIQVLQASAYRRQPECQYFEKCGGCVWQHADFSAQVAFKQRIVEEQLQRIGKVQPQIWLPPIYGLEKYYRMRGRMRVTHDNGHLQLGFQTAQTHQVVDLEHCLIVAPEINHKIRELKQVLAGFAERLKVYAIEFAVGQEVVAINVLAEKSIDKQTLALLQSLKTQWTTVQQSWQWWWQVKNQSTKQLFPKKSGQLFYSLAEFDIKMPFQPNDFTQVNPELNALMVKRALTLLAPENHEKIADLFCGIGNFTLPIAKSGAQVLAIEGLASLTERARQNAKLNHCAGKIKFQTADLFKCSEKIMASWGRLDKILLDPPRAGALAVVESLHPSTLPQRIVYVSCNPATFARDAAVLVKKGYKFKASSIMNLFSHTAHVEMVSLFQR